MNVKPLLIVLLYVSLCACACYANMGLYEYAISQTSEISPDMLCKEEEGQVTCDVENVEWIEGVMVKRFTYNLKIHNNQLVKTKYFELQTYNLNFEGYNLSKLMPSSILCTEKSMLIKDEVKHGKSNRNMVTENVDCNLKSNAYHIAFTANFKTYHRMYNNAKNILEALVMEHKRLIKPIDTMEDENWMQEYYIYPIYVTIWIKSYSLNKILFDLYRREKRIAINESPQNDKDYKTIQDSVLADDYNSFLNKSHEILQTLINQKDITNNTRLELSRFIDSFVLIGTKPNQNLSVTIRGNKGFVLSLDEIDNLVDINEAFYNVITKILRNTYIKVAKQSNEKK